MPAPQLLRWSRIIVASLIFALLTGGLVSYGTTFPRIAEYIARIQFIPAVVVFSLSTIVVWILVTLIFGRIYCSTVCPLGTFQDIIARLPRLGHYPARRNYHYSRPLTLWRNVSLCVAFVAMFLGVSVVVSLLDPYQLYSRFCAVILKPLWGMAIDAFKNPGVVVASASLVGILIAVVTLGIIGTLSFRNGRTFCNSVCPVGTTLGFVSKWSIFHIDIDTDKCIQCRKCEHVCKASCIDLISHVVDGSRCVTCFDCLPVCPNDAIHYTPTRHTLSDPLMRKVRNPLAGSAAGLTDTSANAPETNPDIHE